MTNYRLLLLLVWLYGWPPWVFARKKWSFENSAVFQFTSPVYNMTIEENARGKEVYAISNTSLRIGVSLPDAFSSVKFRIVEGEKSQFKAEAFIVDNFAFLRLKYRQESVLNRELRDKYVFTIKATCKRKDAPNLETTATVNLLIIDQNDAHPIFEKETYSVQVLENIKQLSNIVQVHASDADIGYNGQIYYSILNEVSEFTVDPITGWIRNVKLLSPGIFELHLLAEDRASRLYQNKNPNDKIKSRSSNGLNKATAVINVLKSESSLPILKVEKRLIFGSLFNISQIIATIRTEAQKDEDVQLELINVDCKPCFKITRKSDSNIWLLESVPGHLPQQNWRAVVLAKVNGEAGRVVTTEIEVDVDEARSLKFLDSVFRFYVNESSPVGFVIGRVHATIKNGYSTDYRKLRYSIIPENKSIPFWMNKESGYLHVSDWLDYETKTFYKFNVEVQLEEFHAHSTATVEVIVKDSNDHSPLFAAKWARGEPVVIMENFPLNKTIVKVEALDPDSGENGLVQYMLINEVEIPFFIDAKKGEIKLFHQLPPNVSFWHVKVRAFDSGWPYSRSSQMVLTIYKNGTKPPAKFWPSISRDPANRSPPVFLKFQNEVTIKEDIEVGKIVYVLNATDADSGYAGVIRFGCWDSYFAVQPFTGAVFVLRSLHELFYSKRSNTHKINYELKVTVYDMGEPLKSSNSSLRISIEDCNNHAPKFEKSFYYVHLKEDSPVGTEIIAVKAIDQDFGDNGKVAYRLTGGSGHVEISSNRGVLVVRERFDREVAEQHCFTVVAYDHGQPPKLGFANVTIVLDDVNDNSPKCLMNAQRVQIPEDYPNGALITCITATDADYGENGRVTFALFASDSSSIMPFRIQPDTGCIFLNTKEPLDYETRAFYNLSIKVYDNGHPKLNSSCSLVVQLIDVNENIYPPVFSEFVYEFSVFENMKLGTEVGIIKAKDPETFDSSLKYSVVEGDGVGFFSIDLKGVIRTTAILDHEVNSRYWLAVKAEDDAAVPLSSIVHVLVKVIDSNDHAPMPKSPIYFVSIPENSPDAIVVKVEAEDRDDTAKQKNYGLVYSIVGGDPQSFFSIDSHTGYLTTHGTRQLDREKQKEHTVIVEVCDEGNSSLCTTVPVVVTVEDRNDNPPIFKNQHYKFEVQSGAVGILCRVIASDLDEGENARLSYTVTGDSRFSIDNDGHLSTIEGLDPEEIVSLTVQAMEVVAPYNTSTTRITLLAVGNNSSKKKPNKKPRLINVYQWKRLSVSDADSVGDIVGRIEAEDPDGDKIWWAIVEGNINNIFSLRNDTGVLVMAKSLDFLAPDIKVLKLKFTVSDWIESVYEEVTVEISRYTAKRPHFSATHYKTQVSDKTALGTLIYTIKATVKENETLSHEHSRIITYSIKSVENVGAKDRLRIDPTTGSIYLTATLDHEVSREFSVIVGAKCGQLSNYAMLTIAVINDNNMAPRFFQKEYFIRVFARTPIHNIITTVRAYDKDFGINGVIIYSIIAGNEGGYFNIDETTGEIFIAKSLLLSESIETVLTVRATDRSEFKLSDTCTVRIQSILDEVWLPSFQRSVYPLFVSKSTPVGSLLTIVGLESAVAGFHYFLEKSCDHLEVHPIAGAIYLEKELKNMRSTDHFNCSVFAKNILGDQTSTQLILKIIDVNEYAPVFKQTTFVGFIEERRPAGAVVVSDNGQPLAVRAYDEDLGLNGLVNYKIVSPFEPYFMVDFVTGVVRTKVPLDFEKVKKWSFYVQASDMGSKALSSSVPALVTVLVGDVNDMPPKFAQKKIHAELLLPTLRGVEVSKLVAYDPDTVGSLRYSLNDTNHLFAVDGKSGVVTVRAINSSQFVSSHYKVPVFVTDGVHKDSAVLMVAVKTPSLEPQKLHFLGDEYQISIVENETSAIAQPLVTLTALGLEVDGAITYRILNPHPEFSIGLGSGQISWLGGALDREVSPQINLLVEASSRGANAQKAQKIVVINVEDVNDCEPVFINQPYTAVVSKNAKVGYKIMNIKAVDMDQGENGAIRYSLKENNRYVKLNKYDGRITVAESLASSDIHTLSFAVVVSDQGTPNKSSLAYVNIKVIDYLVPIFSRSVYRGSVSEDIVNNTVVLAVKAISDSNQKLGYLIESGDFKNQFFLDFETGSLKVKRPLDRENTSFYNLSVIAVDVTKDDVHARCFVIIEVEDVNDNPPKFEKSIYRVHISESASIGTEILKVNAVDPDESTSVITYTVLGKDAHAFCVDAMTGHIFLNANLDYEKQRKYEFTLRATDDGGLFSEAILLLFVDDVNDNPPTVVHPPKVIVRSDAEVGQFLTRVEASDVDTVTSLPGPQHLSFLIIDGDETFLNLHNSNGLATLARALTYQDLVAGEKRFNISVSDGIHTVYTKLIITLIRGRNFQPELMFERLIYEIAIRENGKNGTLLITLKAVGSIGAVRYELARNDFDDRWPVQIDETSGIVRTTAVFDYEKRNLYRIPVMATDRDNRRAFAFLLLHIVPENDKLPHFVSSKYEVDILDNVQEEEPVFIAYAIDEDAGDQVEHDLVIADELSQYVKIDAKHGIISVRKLISYHGEKLSFFARATDLANPPHRSMAYVTVNLVPSNTSLPRFSSNQYLFNISEDVPLNTVVGKVQTNSEISMPKFSLPDGEENPEFPFSIESRTGKIITISPLNHNKVPVWRFMVRVTSEGIRMSGSLSLVTVFITKSRKNDALYRSATVDVTVSEDSPIGANIDVFSIDGGSSDSFIAYSLETGESSHLFKIDAQTGVLSVAGKLDRENQESHALAVIASDGEKVVSKTYVHLVVQDVNDLPPKFDREEYVFMVRKEEHSKLFIGKLNITDDDLPESNHIQFSIIKGNENRIFRIGSDGILYLLPDNDGFVPSRTNLTVMVSDGKFYSIIPVKVMVLNNLQDFHCEDEYYERAIPEDAALGVEITKGLQQIPDGFYFKLVDGDPEFLEISKNGRTSLSKKLDRERRDQHSFAILGHGEGAICMWQIHLIVTDVNDEVPTFEKSEYLLTFKENVLASKNNRFFLTNFVAEDLDLGIGGKVSFYFDDQVNSMIRETFHLNENTGVLSLMKPLDREKQENYSFSVKAVDGEGKYSKVKVFVDVADDNDNEPQFEKTLYKFELRESERTGYKIGQVRAFDQDKNDQVKYAIEAPANIRKYVAINEYTGSIELSAPVDHEAIKHISITVTATDSGNPALKSSCIVEIKILDVNDNSPKFPQSSYKTIIRENSPIGTKVIKMVATDADSEQYGQVTYRLSGGNDFFAITEDGWIVVNGELDREKQPAYRLHVSASDGGSPPLSTSTELIISLEDLNDNPPVVNPCNITVFVQENIEPGYIFSKVTVTDEDAAPNAGPFKLTIVGDGSESFSFDSEFNLIANSRLSFSKKRLYLLNVLAYDRGGLSTECPLTIHVRRESRHPPEVFPLKITLNIFMNEYLGGKIGAISARDQDSSDLLRFFMNADASSVFRVIPGTGEIFANAGLTAGTYEFAVNVTDGKYTVQAPVLVNVHSIRQSALDHAVSIRFFNVSAEKFLSEYLPAFEKALGYLGKFQVLSLQENHAKTNGRLVSFGQSYAQSRLRRNHSHRKDSSQAPIILDVLVVVSSAIGYQRPDRISKAFSNILDDLVITDEVKVNITTEVCNMNTCVEGECVGRLYLEESEFPYFFYNHEIFSAPRHERTFECICREGFGGETCTERINRCSEDPCRSSESSINGMMCVPTETTSGYECVCSPGRSGSYCDTPSCDKEITECSKHSEIGVNGHGFFQILVTSSLEESLRLSFNIRTISSDAVIMHGAGENNFHAIEVQKGFVQYRWDCGAGVGVVNASSISISDGRWHHIEVYRYGRSAKLKVDRLHVFQDFSPIGGEVLNLRQNSVRLTFGGQVEFSSFDHSAKLYSPPTITRGLIGCFGLISIDSDELPKTKQGLRLYNTQMGCAVLKNNPCLQNPCSNGGSCLPGSENSFRCICLGPYSGRYCEYLSPCIENPCENRGRCIEQGRSYYCECLPGYTGRNCQIAASWPYCTGNVCGPFGRCVSQPDGFFFCNCSHGYRGRFCDEPPKTIFAETMPLGVGWVHIMIAVGVVVVALLLLCILFVYLIRCCLRSTKRRQMKPSLPKDMEPETLTYNPQLLKRFDSGPNSIAPPPLPPRSRPQLSNFQQAQLTGLPTVQVRPFPVNERFGSSSVTGSRSPSLAESVRCKSRRVSTPSSLKNLEFSRNCVSSADELEPSRFALERFGKIISEEESEGFSSSSSQMRPKRDSVQRRRRPKVRRSSRSGGHDSVPLRNERIAEENFGPKGSSVESDQKMDRRSEGGVELQIKQKHSNISYMEGECIAVGESVLAPRVDDNEYMTMHPISRRLPPKSVESQRRPLLETSDSDGLEESPYVYPDEMCSFQKRKPTPPIHRNRRRDDPAEDNNRVYDNPTNDNTLARYKVTGNGSLKRPLSSPNLSCDFGHIDSENELRTDLKAN